MKKISLSDWEILGPYAHPQNPAHVCSVQFIDYMDLPSTDIQQNIS